MTEPIIPDPPSLAPFGQAILQALRAATGVPWGDLGAPAGVGSATQLYGFLSRVSSEWSGGMGGWYEMVTATYQAQCVALDSDGVDWLEQRVQQALHDAPVVPGWHFIDWQPLGSPGVRLDRDVTPPRTFTTPQWRLIAQPSEEP